MNNFDPLVSIIIPVYNGANYLREAIDSALAQDYNNCEILVINDGSNDDSEKIALSYGDNVRYFDKLNGGVATALNLGIKEMRGEYFSWLSHDDLYFPNKVSSQIELLSKLEDKKTIIAGNWQIIDEYSKEIGKVCPTKKFTEKRLSIPLFPLFNGMIGGIQLLIHKSHFERVGAFREDLPSTQDFDLWFRMMRGQCVKFVDGIISATRLHSEQGTNTIADKHITACNMLWIQMADELTDYEKIAIGGSLRNFYLNLYVFLDSASPYREAVAYMKKNALKHMLPVVGYIQLICMKFWKLAIEFLYALKRRGPKATIKRMFEVIRK